MKKYFFFIIIIIIIIINILYTYYNNKNYEYYSQIQDVVIFTDNKGNIIGTYPENIYDSDTLNQIINRDDWDKLPELVGVVNNPIFVAIPKGNPGNDGNPGTKGPQGPEGPSGPRGPRAFYNMDRELSKGITPVSPVYEDGKDGKTCFEVNGDKTDPENRNKCKDGPPGPPGDTCYDVMKERNELGLLQSGSKTACRPEIRQKKCIDTTSGDEKHINCPQGSPGPYHIECSSNNGTCTPNSEKCNSKYRRYKEQPNYGNLNDINIDDDNLFDEVTETCTNDNTKNNFGKGQDGLTCKEIYEALSNKDLTCGGEGDTEDFCFDDNDHNTKKCYREQGTISSTASNLEAINNNQGLKILKKTNFNKDININKNKTIIFKKTGSPDMEINFDKLNSILQLDNKLKQNCKTCALGQGNNKTNCKEQLDKGECTECPIGHFSNNNISCMKCPPGSYTNIIGQSTCKPCGEGTYAEGEGNTSCAQCSAGSYASGTGTIQCETCLICNDSEYEKSECTASENTKCAEKVCRCPNGERATGSECPNNNEEKCVKCHDGYHLSNGKCYLKQCTCPNGDGATGIQCPNNDDEKCVDCDYGYHLSNEKCNINNCQCPNGDSTTGIQCPNNGDEKCVKCDDGYYLSNGKCYLKQCTCPNGDGATGIQCPNNNDEKCVDCDDGYRLSNEKCYLKQCTCPNGTAQIGKACINHMEPGCTKCKFPYMLSPPSGPYNDSARCVDVTLPGFVPIQYNVRYAACGMNNDDCSVPLPQNVYDIYVAMGR